LNLQEDRTKSIHSEENIIYFIMGKYMYLYIQNGGEEKITQLKICLYIFYLFKCPYIQPKGQNIFSKVHQTVASVYSLGSSNAEDW
jgi:hypothetical protein